MNYEVFFVHIKQRLIDDLGEHFDSKHLDSLSLALTSQPRRRAHAHDQYRSQKSRVPAYYNPNNHTINLNTHILEQADDALVENIYYHELLHAASNHIRLSWGSEKILKSGLKIQIWNESDKQRIFHRSLNEGVTQYFANTYTAGGTAYKNEVAVVGQLVRKIGLQEIKAAYFGPSMELLERKVRFTLGEGLLGKLSDSLDKRDFEKAHALIS